MKKNFVLATSTITLAGLIAFGQQADALSFTVQKGDTLYSLSKKYNLTVNELKKHNNLTSNDIYVGQVLNTTGKVTTPSVPSTPTYTNKKVSLSSGSLNVRSASNTNSSVIGSLKNNDIVKVESVSGDWAKIDYKGKAGYVHNDYLKELYENIVTPSTPVTPPVENKPVLNNKTYTVQNGDTLYRIALENKVSVNDIRNWNKLEGNTIFRGQNLIVGKTTETVSPSKPDPTPEVKPPSQSVTRPDIYTVKSGDWLSKISATYGLTVAELKSYNNLTSDNIYPGQKLKLGKSVFMNPAEGVFTSGFDSRWGRFHYGIDIAKAGTVSIHAAYDGTVSRSYRSSSYGETVFIKHNINGTQYETVYAHMREGSRRVQVGDKVSKGAVIGYMGNTGDSHGQHLHLELHLNEWNSSKSNALNPIDYFSY